MSKNHVSAVLAVTRTAPMKWFDDKHGVGSRPRCCQAIECVAIALAAMGQATDGEARAIARATEDGLVWLCQRR